MVTKMVMVIVVCLLGYLAVMNYGSMYGLTQGDMQTVETYKNQAIDKVSPMLDPAITKDDIQNIEQKMRSVMPTADQVNDAMKNHVVPAIVSTAKKIGDEAQSGLARNGNQSTGNE